MVREMAHGKFLRVWGWGEGVETVSVLAGEYCFQRSFPYARGYYNTFSPRLQGGFQIFFLIINIFLPHSSFPRISRGRGGDWRCGIKCSLGCPVKIGEGDEYVYRNLPRTCFVLLAGVLANVQLLRYEFLR